MVSPDEVASSLSVTKSSPSSGGPEETTVLNKNKNKGRLEYIFFKRPSWIKKIENDRLDLVYILVRAPRGRN